MFVKQLLYLFLLMPIFLFGQIEPSLDEAKKAISKAAVERANRVRAYIEKNSVPASFRDNDGNLVVLVDVSDSGHPYFETTDNTGAAITTGVTQLRDGGELGLNLTGDGLWVGIWDGGVVDDHIEFDSRILSRQGSSEDSHATHVTGTILASGLNANAKGMAPKAKAETFDFSGDSQEMIGMARSDQSGIILSNHSYGLITGWRFNGGWTWQGDPSISAKEDWRFGFYSNAAREWDQIAFNAPYYLIVKSAGNDRSDTGNGNFPPDCNEGSGYDCISDKSVAKNILTVGAVNKVTNYTGPSSIVMSNFSSWGPTDDGRIKPDLVGAGVNIFSTTASSTNDQYGISQGTSMATPNVTGSLVLLQELYKNLYGGSFMRSATLKALAIHAAKEAGLAPGPDYQFGWGLMDAGAAGRFLLNLDNQNNILKEETLANGDKFELQLSPKANTTIKVTLCWTDPAGTPVGATLDPGNIMLVNDLDIRIVDDANNTQFPWILNPGNPTQPATKGDNIRDNVEQIVFENPEPRSYRLTVQHKGSLVGGSQKFSLIVEYNSINDPRTTYYWIGDNGFWSDPSNWSLTSGGPPSGTTPGSEDNVVVDENSFSSVAMSIELDADADCYSLTWLTKSASGLGLNNKTLHINGNLIVTSNEFSVTNQGTILLSGIDLEDKLVSLSNADFSLALLKLGGPMTWTVKGAGMLGDFELSDGTVFIEDQQVSVKSITTTCCAFPNISTRNSVVSGVERIDLYGALWEADGTRIVSSANGVNTFDFNGVNFNGTIQIQNQGRLTGNGEFLIIDGSGILEFSGTMRINELKIAEGSQILISPGSSVGITSNTSINSSPSNRTILATNGIGGATLFTTDYFKLCFDYLDVTNINVTGPGIINAGLNSVIVNSDNWVQRNCDDVLFPDFEVRYNCSGARTEFIDKTSGIVTGWIWDFGDPASGSNSSISRNPNHTYSNQGDYTVTLLASNGTESREISKEITIAGNPIPSNSIVFNGNSLFSFQSGSAYQWFVNDTSIEGAVGRSYEYNGQPGIYMVVIKGNGCNRPSSSFVITEIHEGVESPSFEIEVYPNPATEAINILVSEDWKNSDLLLLNTVDGELLRMNIDRSEVIVDVSTIPKGIYFIRIKRLDKMLIRKIIIN